MIPSLIINGDFIFIVFLEWRTSEVVIQIISFVIYHHIYKKSFVYCIDTFIYHHYV